MKNTYSYSYEYEYEYVGCSDMCVGRRMLMYELNTMNEDVLFSITNTYYSSTHVIVIDTTWTREVNKSKSNE